MGFAGFVIGLVGGGLAWGGGGGVGLGFVGWFAGMMVGWTKKTAARDEGEARIAQVEARVRDLHNRLGTLEKTRGVETSVAPEAQVERPVFVAPVAPVIPARAPAVTPVEAEVQSTQAQPERVSEPLRPPQPEAPADEPVMPEAAMPVVSEPSLLERLLEGNLVAKIGGVI